MSIYGNRPSLSPKLNGFNLSHNHYTTMDMGLLYPIMYQECIPSDVHQVDIQALVRCLPLVKPILNNLIVEIDAFFVPYRILWNEWEDFFTTIKQDSIPPESYEGTPPVFGQHDDGTFDNIPLYLGKEYLWSRFGLNVKLGDLVSLNNTTPESLSVYADYLPTDFFRRAYYDIWNNWYRDQNFQPPIDYRNSSIQTLMPRAWKKDYFTASLYSRQKGTAPTIPLTGTGSVLFSGTPPTTSAYTSTTGKIIGTPYAQNINYLVSKVDTTDVSLQYNASNSQALTLEGSVSNSFLTDAGFVDWLNTNNQMDMSNVGTFDINDFRQMNAIQRQMEGLMLFGSRYIEVLKGIYNTSPTDARLQIPERLGGFSFNIRVDEVLQTSSSTADSPQGNQVGHGAAATQSSMFTYKAEEVGIIIVLASVQPSAIYCNRFPREFFRKTRLDQVSPYFVNLGFQAIKNAEIFGQLKEADNGVWAYQGMYDECRERQDYVTGQLLDNMRPYVSLRMFDSLPAMNGDFIACNPEDDIFAVTDEDKFICRFYFEINSLRPIPEYSIPGLLDHVYGG